MVSSIILSSLTFGLLISASFSEAATVFCYDEADCDPYSSMWPGVCQDGKHQSPIDLRRDLFSLFSTPKSVPLNFNGGYSAPQFLIKDNGHTVQVSFNSQLTSNAQMTGYGLEVPYTFAQAHFHWGKDSMSGSEHSIGGLHHPMELHLVHYSTKYPSFSAAAASGDPTALAVVGVFLDPTPTLWNETFINTVPAFDVIANNLPMKFETTDEVVNQPIDLSQFLPKPTDAFYRYNGSLTTPGCAEIVVWTVVEKPKIIKDFEYKRFHNVQGEEANLLGRNFRPTYPVGDRKVEYLRKA